MEGKRLGLDLLHETDGASAKTVIGMASTRYSGELPILDLSYFTREISGQFIYRS